jgi:ubiquitin carboxyl-terminal hydrolase 10
MPHINRSLVQTPPIAHSQAPPVMRNQTPQPVVSSPSVASTHLVNSPTLSTGITTSKMPSRTPSQSSFSAPSRKPFHPPLPWLSVPDAAFPPRASQKKKRRRGPVLASDEGLAFPTRDQAAEDDEVSEIPEVQVEPDLTPTEGREDSQASTLDAPSEIETETPSTSHPPSEAGSAHHTTPSSAMPPPQPRSAGAAHSHTRTTTKPVVPLIPIRSNKATSITSTTQKSVKSVAPTEEAKADGVTLPATEASASAEETSKASPPPKAAPKSWAELLRAKNAPAVAQAPPSVPNGVVPTNGATAPKSNSLSDVLASFSVDADKKVSFLEPRGLVNSGNICYMNSVGIWCLAVPL